MWSGPERLLAIGFLLVVSSIAAAQTGSISGRVTRTDGQAALGGARVQVLTGTRAMASTLSMEDGAYTVSGIAVGTYEMLVTRIGYAPQRTAAVSVTAGGSTRVDVALRAAVTQLDAVVATASRRLEKALDAPAQIAVVTEEAIEERATVTLEGHLRGTPGVDVNQGGIAQTNIVARGFNNAFSGSMLMLQDYRFAGVPSLRVNIPLLFTGTNEDIERVEVLLGPASALFGPNSANGVLHVLTKSPFTSQGTTMTLDGGERSLIRGALRTAHTFGDKIGVKLSGEYMQGKDFEYKDPGEPDLVMRGGVMVANLRDFDVNRHTGEARLDYRPRDGMELITTAGTTMIRSGLELTGANGTAQIKNWRYQSIQQRFTWNRFFAQAFVNSSDAGNKDSTDTRGTFLLRSGQPIVDQSQVYSVQAQHGYDFRTRLSFTYGADYIFTNPSTGRTINGRNEERDDMQEYGAYVQGTAKLTDRFDLLGAMRVDQHELVEGTFVSPRAALIFKPTANQNLRATYNRAFNTPQNFSFFLDLLQVRNPSGLPFNVRAMGNPPNAGWKFERTCATGAGGLCMRSAFVPTSAAPGAMIPAQAGLGLPGFVTARRTSLIAGLTAQFVAAGQSAATSSALATGIVNQLQTSPASLASIVTELRYLGQTAASNITPANLADIKALKASFNNTYEVGYKGVVGRLRYDVAAWSQNRGDVGTPAALATPSAFMNGASLTANMAPRISLVLQGFGFPVGVADAQAAAIAAGLSTSLSPAPMGTVTFNDPTLAPNSDVLATYRTLDKEVNLWGSDLAVDYQLTDALVLAATYGYASKTIFDTLIFSTLLPRPPRPANTPPLLASNAPAHKASLAARYSAVRGWGGELRGRYADAYQVHSGVYSSFSTFLSPNPGGAPYSYKPVPVNMMVDAGVNYRFTLTGRPALWSLNATNLLDNKQPTFPGVPSIGRMAITRVQYTF